MPRPWKALFLVVLLGINILDHVVAAAENIKPVFSNEAEKIFNQGLKYYRSGEFKNARKVFSKLNDLGMHQHSSASLFMLAKALFNLAEYTETLKITKEFGRRFPQSRYAAAVGILAGDALFISKRFYEAGDAYASVLLLDETTFPQVQAAERLAGIVKKNLINTQGLARIKQVLGADQLDEALLFGESQWYKRLGWEGSSHTQLKAYLANYPAGRFTQWELAGKRIKTAEQTVGTTDVLDLESKYESGSFVKEGKPKLGLLLPLSGPQRAIGRDLLSGAELANRQYNQPFELMVRDTGIDYNDVPIAEGPATELMRTALAARQLIQEGACALIGPIFSSTSVAAALVAQAAQIPLLTPLAQQSGLDSLGNYVFQLNVIPEIQGRVLGEYATMVLGLKTIAIMSPLTDYGISFESEFRRVASENGAEIVHQNWYVPKEKKDFKNELEELRKVGFNLYSAVRMDSLARLDSLAWTLLDTALLSAVDRQEVFTALLGDINSMEYTADPPDSSELFIETIDAVVVIVENFEDAKTIAPQLRFKRLRTQILGNDIWNDPDAIRQMPPAQRKDIEGTILVSASPSGDQKLRDFIALFRQTFGRYPGYTAYDPGFAAYGYDAAEMVIQGWENQARTPSALRQWLADIRDFEGAGGRISFSDNRRTNTEMTLMKIVKGGRVRAIKDSDLPLFGISNEGKGSNKTSD